MLVILPDDEADAKWLIDHLVTKIQGNHTGLGTDTPLPNETADDPLPPHSKHTFGKLRMQSRFSRSDSSLGDTADEGESESFNSEGDNHHAQEWFEMNQRDWIHLPFELQATDSILLSVNELLAKDTKELEETSNNYIDHIMQQKNLGDDHFRIIRVIKDGRQEMSSRVKGFCASMTRTLNEGTWDVKTTLVFVVVAHSSIYSVPAHSLDEDMALMNLSRLITHPENFIQPVSPEVLENESDEPELILESHLQHGYSLMNTLELIQGKVESASDLWEQRLDATRNKILLANMLLTTVSLCLTATSVVGSFLGMNIGVPGQGVDGYFMPVVVGTVGGSVLLGLLILAALILTGTIQRTPPFGAGGDDE